jgi:gliding motility-associated-like protein
MLPERRYYSSIYFINLLDNIFLINLNNNNIRMDLHLLSFRKIFRYVIATLVLITMVTANVRAQVVINSAYKGDYINGNNGNAVLNSTVGAGATYFEPHISTITQCVTLDGANNIAFSQNGQPHIMRVDAANSHVITYPATSGINSMSIDRDNEFIYTSIGGSPNSIVRYIWKSTGSNLSMGYYIGASAGTATTVVPTIPFIVSGDMVFMNGASTATALTLGVITTSLAFDPNGNLYYADGTNSVVREIAIEKGTPLTTASGATSITLSKVPTAAVKVGDKVSGLYIPAGDYITAISGSTITISIATTGAIDGTSTLAFITGVNDIAGTFGTAGTTLGATGGAATTLLKTPQGLTFDPAGNLFILDQYNATARILKIPSPVSSTAAIATFGSGFGGTIQGIATDANGNLYIADKGNQRIVKVSASGGAASIIFGSGSSISINPVTITAGSPVVTTTDLTDLLKVDVGMKIRLFGSIVPSSTVVSVNTQTAPYSLTLSYPQGATVATPDGTAALGSTSLTVSANTSIAAGQYVAGAGIPSNTTVVSISGTTVVLSAPTTAALSNTQLFFYASTVYNVPSTGLSVGMSSEDGFTTSNGSMGYIENPYGIAVTNDPNNPVVYYSEQYQDYTRSLSGGSVNTTTNVPTITSYTPTTTSAGATVTITGTNFTGATDVNFGGVDATSFTVVSATSITAVVGTGTNGLVYVTTPSGTAFSPSAIKITPTITSFTPTSGLAGTTVTITGTNFLNAGTASVKIGGTAVAATSVIANSNSTLIVVTGTGASGTIAVTTNSGTATSSGSFTFISAPTSLAYASPTTTVGYGTAGASAAPTLAAPNVLTYTISPVPPAGITIDPATGIISYANTVAPGSYPFTVTAANALGTVTAPFTLTVNALAPAALVYSTSSSTVIRGTAGTSVTPTINTGGATVTYSLTGTVPGGVTIDPASGIISYDNTVTVGNYPLTVTATNLTGSTTATYTLTINPSSNNNLSTLSISSGTLTPAFNSATINYVVGVPISTTSVTFTPTVSDAFASVQVNGVTTTSGSASAGVSLISGTNNINIVVTAQDGTVKTYTVNVIQSSLSNNAQLSAMVLNNGTLSPSFSSATTNYTASVSNTTTSITVTPTLANAAATQTVNGTAISSGATSSPINLTVGDNIINTVVSAQDGVTVVTYSVDVNRAASSNNNLSSLAISSGSLSPIFASGTLSYTATVANAITSITFTPAVAEPNATIKINGVTATSGSASAAIPLTVGANTIPIVVTAQNGSINTYTVIVTKLGLAQTITFAALNAVNYGAANIAAGASSTNNTIPLTYTSSNTGVATIATDGTIHILSAGSTNITVSQAANAVYQVATPVIQTLTVNPAVLTITANNLSKVYGAANPALTVTYAGFVNNDNSASLVAQPTVSTTATTTSGVSTYPITASGASSPNYTINYVPGVLTITGATRTVTFAALAAQTYGNPDFALTATVSSGETATYTSSDPTIATIVNGTVHIVSAGTVTITASAPVNGNYTTAPSVGQSLLINKASQTITFATIPTQIKGGTLLLSATASTGLPITFTSSDPKIASINGQSANLLAEGTTAITAIQAGNIDYFPVVASQFLTVQNNLVTVHTGLSPNGDGINDYLQIDGIKDYPVNKLTIVDRNGIKVFQTSNYDNISNNFTGHSNSGGAIQAGTYFYELELNVNGESKRISGYIVLKYN